MRGRAREREKEKEGTDREEVGNEEGEERRARVDHVS